MRCTFLSHLLPCEDKLAAVQIDIRHVWDLNYYYCLDLTNTMPIRAKLPVSFHTKVRQFFSLGINPKICPKEPTVNTNPNNQSHSTVVPRDTVAPCPYVYRHSGVRTM